MGEGSDASLLMNLRGRRRKHKQHLIVGVPVVYMIAVERVGIGCKDSC